MKRLINYALFELLILAFQNSDAQTTKLTSSFFGSMEAREIGPAVMSGRILSIDAFNDDPRLVLVGAASGGLWKSTNGGTTFKEVFKDHVQTIGAVAINQKNKDNVWVGTGDSLLLDDVFQKLNCLLILLTYYLSPALTSLPMHQRVDSTCHSGVPTERPP